MRAWRVYVRVGRTQSTMAHVSSISNIILMTTHFTSRGWEDIIISSPNSKEIFVRIEVFLINGYNFVKEHNITTTIQNYKQQGETIGKLKELSWISIADSLSLLWIKFYSRCFPFISSFNPYNNPER